MKVTIINPPRDRCRKGHLLISCTVYVDKDGNRTCKVCAHAADHRRYMNFTGPRWLGSRKGGVR